MLPGTSKDCIDRRDCSSTTSAPQGFIAAPKSTVIQRRRSCYTNGEQTQWHKGCRDFINFPPVNLLWQMKLHEIDMLDSQPSKMLLIILQTGLPCRSSNSPVLQLAWTVGGDGENFYWPQLCVCLAKCCFMTLYDFGGNYQAWTAWMISLVEQ